MDFDEAEVAAQKNWSELEPSFSVKVFLTVLYSLILVTGILGNAVTIRVTQVLRRNGYLQKNVTDHMVSLACSDLLVLLIGMPVELYSATWYPFTSAEDDAPCKIYNFLFEACSYATILNVATLSFERYTAICHPFHFKALTGRRTSLLISFAWLTSVAVALPLLMATGIEGPELPSAEDMAEDERLGHVRTPTHNLTFCTNLSERWLMYRVSVFTAFCVYLGVLICVGVMCRAMILVLRRPMGNGTEGGGGGAGVAAPKHESSKAKMARKQTILFLGLIVGSLMVCWMPYQVRRLMTAAVRKRDWTVFYFRAYVALHPVGDTFFYLSSVLNPFLYNLSSRQFRDVFLQVLLCRVTVQHVNKRHIPRSSSEAAGSARSLRPLLLKSLRLSKASRSSTAAAEAPPRPVLATFRTADAAATTNSAVGSSEDARETTMCLVERSDSSATRTKRAVLSESEI